MITGYRVQNRQAKYSYIYNVRSSKEGLYIMYFYGEEELGQNLEPCNGIVNIIVVK